MIKRIQHIFLVAFVPMLVLFQFGQINYLHYHVDKSGILVAHSHPYHSASDEDGIPNAGHHHSSSEMLLLQILEGGFLNNSFHSFAPEIAEFTIHPSVPLLAISNIHNYSLTNIDLRGPPALLF